MTALDGNPPTDQLIITGVEPGLRTVRVTDESGCSIDIEVMVLSDVDYDTIENIVVSSCAVSGCHAGNVSPDFREKSNIIGRASRILSRTANQTMPPRSSGVELTQAEIDAIACWFNDGAPE